jgi:hypothetical protein
MRPGLSSAGRGVPSHKRMGAKTIEVKASHLVLISHPDEITRLILQPAGQQARRDPMRP